MMDQKAPLGSTRPIIPAGTQLNGIYEIDAPIAAGGMGEVYRGHTIQTGDLVAIKVIRSDLAEAEAALALFRKEASALHNLYHEAIVRYYVFTIDPTLQRPYLAMEFVDGQSLSAMLRGGPLAYEAVHRLMQRVATGLQAAHEGGIVHRDMSPDNIIIPGGDMAKAKIIDFGIARSTQLGDEGTVIGTGFAGKYNYVSPEQLGLFGGNVSPRSDIYSFGLVLVEALRQRPIDMGGNHVDVIEKRRKVPDLSDIDARIRPLLERMLQPNPDDRPGSMAEVATWPLDPPRKGSASPSPSGPASSTRISEPIFGTRTVLIGGVALALAISIGFATTIALHRPKKIDALPKIELQAATGPETQPQTPQPETPRLQAPSSQTPRLQPAAPRQAPTTKLGLAPPKHIGPLAAAPLGTDAKVAAVLATSRMDRLIGHDRIDAVTRYISNYEGGRCFFVKPVAINDRVTAIEGFGKSLEPFRSLDKAFRYRNGFEADIGVQLVSPPQCPAITFLSRLRGSPASAPKLDLKATRLKAGQSLVGTVSGVGARHVEVLLVAANGSVQSIPLTRAQGGGDSFSFSAMPSDSKPELLVVVASPKPLPILQGGVTKPADHLFPEVFAEAERNGVSLAASLRSVKMAP
jgi:serine/threonine protein kinase